MSEKILIETINGEKLIGQIVEPKDALFQELMKQQMPFVALDKLPEGIWLLREIKQLEEDKGRVYVSFIAQEEIVRQRQPTIFDVEVTRKLEKK